MNDRRIDGMLLAAVQDNDYKRVLALTKRLLKGFRKEREVENEAFSFLGAVKELQARDRAGVLAVLDGLESLDVTAR